MCIFAKLNHYSTSVVMRRNPFFISILMLLWRLPVGSG